MVHRKIEKSLNLRLVQIHRQYPVRAGGAEDVGDELHRYRHSRSVLAILAGIAVIGQHRGDPRRRRSPERVDHDQQLDQVLIDGCGGWLHDEDVGAADVLVDLERDLGVGKPPQPRLAHLHAEKRRNVAGESGMGAARKHLQFAEPDRHEGITHVTWQPYRPPSRSARRGQPSAWPGNRSSRAWAPERRLAGAEGFEPSNTGSKVPRLTAWPRPTVP